MKTFSFWKKSIYSAFIFFWTIILLTLVYAGVTNVFYSDLPNANSGSGLTVTSWNNLVNYANKAVKQDTEILTVTGGNVGIGTASPSPTAKLHVAGDIIGSAQIFKAYMTANFAKAANWEKLPFNATVFNTLQGTFNTTNNRFTASRAGYYQISITGYSSTPGSGSERYGIAILKNGGQETISGGSYSASDTPLSWPTMIVYMNGTTDYVEIWAFSAIAATWSGGSGSGYSVLWHMNYLGS